MGLFLSLDGPDGAGKSTQTQLLADWLRTLGHTVTLCTDPGGTELGLHLRQLLLNYRGTMSLPAEALLFMASRAQLVAEVIRPALKAGQIVISDRYILANVVYQGHAGGLDPEFLWQAGLLSTGSLEPNQVFVLDLPLEASKARRKPHADRLESRGEEYHLRVRKGFLIEAEKHPDKIRVIDASGSTEQVQDELRRQVQRLLIV